MIKKTSMKSKKLFSTYDIETDRDGKVLCVGLYNPNKEEYNDFYSFNTFFDFLSDNNDDSGYHLLFAHNAGNFDAVSFLYWLLKENEDFNQDKDRLKIIMTGSTVVFFEYTGFKNKIVFADSNLTLKNSLKKLCEIFEPEHYKLETFDIAQITEVFKDDPGLVLEYLKHDCISLAEIMIKFQELMDIDFFPLTAASFSYYIFQSEYLHEKMYKPTKKQDEFITQAYAGGRVECFRQGYHDQVYSFDINSLYPYVMSKAQIPVNCSPVKTYDYVVGKIGFYKVKFNQFNTDLPPVLWQKSPMHGLMFVYQGEGVFCSLEIDKAVEVGCEVDFIEGYYFDETANIFELFVNTHYSKRLEYKNIEKETGVKQPMQMILKLMMNSLYGKFAQKEESEHLEIMDDVTREEYLSDLVLDDNQAPVAVHSEDFDGNLLYKDDGSPVMEFLCNNSIHIYDEASGLMTVKTKRDIRHRVVYVSAIITAMARLELYKYLELYKDDVLYCDTDSVHLTKKDCVNQGDHLGAMKPEESGKGVYIGRKMYAIDNKKIKFKGITNDCKLGGDSLRFNNMLEILNQTQETEQGEDVFKFSFNTFPKLKSCLTGRAVPAKVINVTKKLKKPGYTSNFRREHGKCKRIKING